MFDGEGFVRGLRHRGCEIAGKCALVVGSGGVGSAIAASLAHAGVAGLALFDVDGSASDRLAHRLRQHYPALVIATGIRDPAGYDIVVNATPLGMAEGDPLPLDVGRLSASTYVGEVVLSREITPFLAAARRLGCATQTGLDMLFEQIPAYLEFFGYPPATAQELRAVARISDLASRRWRRRTA
jgi:shikimate dehydrogenase